MAEPHITGGSTGDAQVTRHPHSDATRATFDDICSRLNADEATTHRAWSTIERLADRSSDVESKTASSEKGMIVCALYHAGKNSSTTTVSGAQTQGNHISLNQLLKAAEISVMDFFEYFNTFISAMQLGSGAEAQNRVLKESYVIINVIFNQYQKLFQKLFNYTPSPTAHLKRTRSLEDLLFTFGWLLFLSAKNKLFVGQFPDLMTQFHLMVSVVHVLFVHSPPDIRKVAFDQPPFARDLMTPSMGVTPSPSPAPSPAAVSPSALAAPATLEHLCALCGANVAEVIPLHQQLLDHVRTLISTPSLLMVDAGEGRKSSEPVFADCDYFSGLLDNFLVHNVRALDSEYSANALGSDFDERMLLQPSVPDNVAVSATPTRTPVTRPQPMRRTVMQTPATPSKSAAPQTPMTKALQTTSWLVQTLKQEPDGPSATLERFLTACSVSPRERIVQLVESLLNRISFPSDMMLRDASSQRRTLCSKLYYRVLTAVLLGEEQRLQTNNFSALLNNESFHRQLLACAIETVVYAYKLPSMAFPFVLGKLEVAPFDFCKVIESFVKYEPTLPRVIVEHLKNLQIQIVESLAWQEDSPLFALLEDATMQKIIVANANASVGTPRRTSARPPASPARTPQRGTPMSPPPPHSPARMGAPANAPPPSPAHAAIKDSVAPRATSSLYVELFMRKVLYLAHRRITDICEALEMTSTMLKQQVWSTFLHVLSDLLDLLKGRHIDQIIMCCIFCVARANKMNQIAFRDIIHQYRLLFNGNGKVYREVKMNSKDSTDTVIVFYNKIFVNHIKGYIANFVAGSGALQPLPDIPASPQTKQYGRMTVKMSPMRTPYAVSTPQPPVPPSPQQMTPRTHALYAFDTNSAKRLRMISQPAPDSSLTRRLFEDEPETKRIRPIHKSLMQLQSGAPPVMRPSPTAAITTEQSSKELTSDSEMADAGQQ